LRFEAPELHARLDVLPARNLRRGNRPQRPVEILGTAAAEAVAVIEKPRLAPREHGVGLGEVAEASLRLGRRAPVGMPVPRQRVEGAADRLLVRIAGEPQDLVVIALDGGHASLFWTTGKSAQPEPHAPHQKLAATTTYRPTRIAPSSQVLSPS